MRLKIIILDGSSNPPVFIKRLFQGLAENGHQIYVLHFGSLNKKQKNIQYISLGSSHSYVQLVLQSIKLCLKYSVFSLWDTFKKIGLRDRKSLQKHNFKLISDQLKPDLIHAQWPSVLKFLENELNRQKYPVVLSQRGYQVNVKPFVDYSYLKILANYYSKIAGFHSVSNAIRERGDLIWSSSHKLNTVVYTGLDLNKFQFDKDYSRGNILKLSLIARPHWKKGLHDAILACAILKERDVDFELTIVGGKGNEEILFLIDRYNLQDNIKITGRVSEKEVSNIILSSQLYIVSSLEEGLPNVLIEAMALGIPVISTDCGGVSEVITHEKEGWIVPTRNPGALAAQIEKFTLLSDDEVNIIRMNARKRIEKQHSSRTMLEGMEKFYETVIAKFRNEA